MEENTSPQEGVRGVLDVNGAASAISDLLARETDNPETEEQPTGPEEGLEASEFVEDVDTTEDPPEIEEDLELAESDDVDLAEEETEEPQKFTVKAAGETHEVTLSELIGGYQRQSDYTKGKQELAESKRLLTEELLQAQQERQRMKTSLDAMAAQLKTSEVQPPDPGLRDIDPQEYLLQRDEWDQHQRKIRAVQTEQKRISDEQNKAHQNALSEMAARENALLLEKIPEWQDNKKREEDTKSMMTYASQTLGYTEEELHQIYDSRLVLALQKLWKYEAAAAPDSKARKKVQKAPKVVKSGQRQSRKQAPKQVQDARRRLKQSGSVNDLAAVLLQMQ